MFNLFRSRPATQELRPAEVRRLLESSAITLVDVRESAEWSANRIPGALSVPLSRFEQLAGTIPTSRPVVLHCLSGGRSARALGLCAKLGLPIDTHMAGGISAWSAEGHPVAHGPA